MVVEVVQVLASRFCDRLALVPLEVQLLSRQRVALDEVHAALFRLETWCRFDQGKQIELVILLAGLSCVVHQLLDIHRLGSIMVLCWLSAVVSSRLSLFVYFLPLPVVIFPFASLTLVIDFVLWFAGSILVINSFFLVLSTLVSIVGFTGFRHIILAWSLVVLRCLPVDLLLRSRLIDRLLLISRVSGSCLFPSFDFLRFFSCWVSVA